MAKKTKAESEYAPAKPGGDQCRECKWFERPHRCEIVEGAIAPDGWCKFFHRRTRRYDNDNVRARIAEMRTT